MPVIGAAAALRGRGAVTSRAFIMRLSSNSINVAPACECRIRGASGKPMFAVAITFGRIASSARSLLALSSLASAGCSME
jgi:hypothetical protein